MRKDFRQPCRSCAQSDALACFYLTLCRNRRGLSTQKRQKPGRYVKYLPGPKPPPVCSARPLFRRRQGRPRAPCACGRRRKRRPAKQRPRYGGRIRQARAVRSGQQRDDDAGQKRQHRDNQNPKMRFTCPSSPYAVNIIISILQGARKVNCKLMNDLFTDFAPGAYTQRRRSCRTPPAYHNGGGGQYSLLKERAGVSMIKGGDCSEI